MQSDDKQSAKALIERIKQKGRKYDEKESYTKENVEKDIQEELLKERNPDYAIAPKKTK